MASRKPKFDDITRRDSDRLPTACAEAAPTPTKTELENRKKATLRTVSVFNLKPHPMQPPERHSPENVADLLVSITDLGLQEPPHAWLQPDGSYVILFGHRRVRACQLGALDGVLGAKIRVFVRSDLSDGDAMVLMAAEAMHKKETDPLHTATLIGQASLQMDPSGQRRLTSRQVAAVLPRGRTFVSQHLKIYDALQDPRLGPLVRSADKAPTSVLYNILRQDDFSAQVRALEAYAEKGSSGAKAVINAGTGGRPAKTVARRKRGKGYDLTVRIRRTMSELEIEEAREALAQAIQDLTTIPIATKTPASDS